MPSNFETDPYRAAVGMIAEALTLAEEYQEGMSEEEHETLASVGVALKARDPHIAGIPFSMQEVE